jgi:hypothetical protein
VAAFRPTRAAAERAAAELTTRQADQPPEPSPVTTKEWLAAHDAEAKAEDPYRTITDDHDLAEVADQRAQDQRDIDRGKPLAQSPEPFIPRFGPTSWTSMWESASRGVDARLVPS